MTEAATLAEQLRFYLFVSGIFIGYFLTRAKDEIAGWE